jgi:uncharacterized protein
MQGPMEAWELILVAGGGLLAGLVGALLGLGGGLIAVPFLNLLLKVPMHQAAAAGLISTLAVSCGAAGRYLRQGRLVDIYLALDIELAASLGGLLGGFVVGYLGGPVLQILFAVLLVYSGVQILRTAGRTDDKPQQASELTRARKLVTMGLCLLAGVLSGLLGIGGGLVVVPVLYLILGLPFKSSAATSNFMMGLTAVPALSGFIARGQLELGIAGPLAAGVLLGATLGARIMPRIRTGWLKTAFSFVLLATAVEMARKGMGAW